MRTRFLASLLVVAVAGLALAACDDDGSSGTTPDATKPTSVGGPVETAVTNASGIPSTITTSLGIGSTDPSGDGEYTVTIVAFRVEEPGIGAWTFNVRYDPAALSVVDCPSEGTQVCNPEFEDDALRFAGASAEGLLGDVVLGTIVFRCEASGPAALEIELELLADATIGDPRDVESATVSEELSELDCA